MDDGDVNTPGETILNGELEVRQVLRMGSCFWCGVRIGARRMNGAVLAGAVGGMMIIIDGALREAGDGREGAETSQTKFVHALMITIYK